MLSVRPLRRYEHDFFDLHGSVRKMVSVANRRHNVAELKETGQILLTAYIYTSALYKPFTTWLQVKHGAYWRPQLVPDLAKESVIPDSHRQKWLRIQLIHKLTWEKDIMLKNVLIDTKNSDKYHEAVNCAE